MNDTELKRRAVEIFLKYGAEGNNTKLFDNLTDEKKTLWKGKVKNQVELPILTYFQDKDIWILITTKRIIWQFNEDNFELNFSEVNKVVVNLQRFLLVGRKPSDLNLLDIVTNQQVFVINIESGLPFNGVLYILNFLARHL